MSENESDKLYKEALELANNEANASKEKARLEIEAQTSAARDQLFKPVGNIVEKREKFVSNNLIEAKNKLSEVKKLEADLLTQLQSARAEAQRIVSEAENESDKLFKEALELANNEANASKEKARLEIESQTSAARDQLSKQADDLSELIVNRLILEK